MHSQKYSVLITPQILVGSVDTPPSKSVSHRAVICAGLCDTPSHLENMALSEDIIATIDAMKQFGAEVEILSGDNNRHRLRVVNPLMKAFYRGEGYPVAKEIEIECNESGSTARFLMPLFHLSDAAVVYKGAARLSERPYLPYYEIWDLQKIAYETKNGGLPLRIQGHLTPGTFNLVGDVSSQFISGLMFLLPLLDGRSEILIQPPLESKDYVELTVAVLESFGIKMQKKSELDYIIEGNQRYVGIHQTIEGDFSQAAFWLVASRLGNKVVTKGLDVNSKQADRVILDVLSGAVQWHDGVLSVSEEALTPLEVDVSQCPDLVPILAVLCALTPGKSKIVNAKRVRLKESDRLTAIATELGKMGAKVVELEEGLEIEGVEKLKGASVDSWNDHRIAMALAIAATRAEGVTKIEGAQCVRKSYPEFWHVYQSLGGTINVE